MMDVPTNPAPEQTTQAIGSYIAKNGSRTSDETVVCIIFRCKSKKLDRHPLFITERELYSYFYESSPILVKYGTTFYPSERARTTVGKDAKTRHLRVLDFKNHMSRNMMPRKHFDAVYDEWLSTRMTSCATGFLGQTNMNPVSSLTNEAPNDDEPISTFVSFETEHQDGAFGFIVDEINIKPKDGDNSRQTSKRLVDFRLMQFDLSYWYPNEDEAAVAVDHSSYDVAFLIMISLLSNDEEYETILSNMDGETRENMGIMSLAVMMSMGLAPSRPTTSPFCEDFSKSL